MKFDRRNWCARVSSLALGAIVVSSFLAASSASAATHAQAAGAKKPNIIVIMGDDVGWFNIGTYHRGIMSGKTPHLDKLAAQGMMFTDYYAEASCTAGRANFITGEIPLRTGWTTVGQAGADVGLASRSQSVLMSDGVSEAENPEGSSLARWR